MNKETCKASQLIARLESMIAIYGDLPVYALDADTLELLPIGLVHQLPDGEEYPEDAERLEIRTDYNKRPYGDVLKYYGERND